MQRHGDNVLADPTMSGMLSDAGTLRDVTLFYLDVQLGAWLWRDDSPRSRRRLTGVASILEFHYNRNLDSPGEVNFGSSVTDGVLSTFRIGDSDTEIDVLNLNAGTAFNFRNNTSITATYGLPLTNGKQFDSEIRVLFNRFL